MTITMKYKCIAIDPPWPEYGGGKIKRGAQRWYSLIKKKEDVLRVILQAPVWTPDEQCHLWLWATNNHLPDALWLMAALGFTYKTNRAWGKMEASEVKAIKPDKRQEKWTQYPEIDPGMYFKKQHHGLGQYMWGEHELLLFGTRGKAMKPPTEGRPGTLILAPRTKTHSEKPEQAYIDMEFVSPGPRLEMFARGPRESWTVWGNQA